MGSRRVRRLRGRATLLALLLLASACAGTDATSQETQPAPAAESAVATATVPPVATTAPVSVPTPEAAPEPTPVEVVVDDRWDPAVRELVAFIETARGAPFVVVPEINYVSQAQLQAEVLLSWPSIDDFPPNIVRVAERIDDVYRALGIAQQEFNVLGSGEAVLANVDAFYEPATQAIRFPSENGAVLDEIPLANRPLMVHELFHAHQEGERNAWAQAMEDPLVRRSMLEGEAEWMLDRYVTTELTDEEFDEWFNADEPTAAGTDSIESVAGPPEVLTTQFRSPYFLGSRFFHVRFELDGLDGVNQVFESDQIAARVLLDPWAFDPAGSAAESFGFNAPSQTEPGDPLFIAGDVPMSAVDWYYAFASVMTGPEALRAARGVGSLGLPSGWVDPIGQTCFEVWVNAIDDQRPAVEAALLTWAAAPGVQRWMQPQDDFWRLGGCDPGAGNVPEPQLSPVTALNAASLVIDAELWAFRQGLDREIGFCVGWDFVGAIAADPSVSTSAWYDNLDPSTLTANC